MSGERQPTTTENTIINRVAKDSGTPKPALLKMVGASEEAITYEAGLDQELDRKETLSSIIEKIRKNGFIEGKQVG